MLTAGFMLQVYRHSSPMLLTKSPNYFTKSGSRVFGFGLDGSVRSDGRSYFRGMQKLSLLFLVALLAGSFGSQAQVAASFTVSHMGLAPSSEATVNIGDTVLFIYGSGGPHPMTSGHNQTPSPTFFPTVTVTSGEPEATATFDEAGVYYFHCGTNPNNSNNWGTLTVVDPNNPNAVSEEAASAWTLQTNVVRNEVVLNGQNWPEEVVLFSMSGQAIQRWNPALSGGVLSVAGLPQGTYVLRGNEGGAKTLWIQQ